ncbi:MAG: SDR family NAD(P)-dependent oxidoreductase [Candidatus Kariarchaeaceae archaeon]|jgi:malonyl CoA-acyl carrier protein transacylase
MSSTPKLDVPQQFSPEPIAIVGLGGLFPDAKNIAEFWNNIVSGRNSIGDIPDDRWDPDLYYSSDRNEPDKTYSKIGAFIKDFEFNSLEYRIPPMVVNSIDIVQQMALYASKEALEDANYQSKDFPNERCAVIIGNSLGGEISIDFNRRVFFPHIIQSLQASKKFQAISRADQENLLKELETEYKKDLAAITEDSMPGELANVIAGRIASVFNLRGMNITSDAACASSLAAIDIAFKGLQTHEYDAAVVGGADRSMDPTTFVKFSKIGALSPTGSYPFDKRANGFVMGEGAGVFILKRLSDAKKIGDKIYALIIGVGSSSDGKGKGITAPNPIGQELAVKRAFAASGIQPKDIQLVEAHGTSTSVGDLVEFNTIDKTFKENDVKPHSILIGSIKSQIGHLKSAAGAAAIIKATLAIQHKIFPPSINFETPNPNIDWENSPFEVNTTAKKWEVNDGIIRRAGVSSFGFGGTNFHILLEEYDPNKVHTTPINLQSTDTGLNWEEYCQRNSKLEKEAILISGKTQKDLLQNIEKLPELIPEKTITKDRNGKPLLDVVRSLNFKHSDPLRMGLSIGKYGDLEKYVKLAKGSLKDKTKQGVARARGIYISNGLPEGKLVFLFPGQGSQYADMLFDLSLKYQSIKETFEEADSILLKFLGKPLSSYIFTRNRDINEIEKGLRQTQITQPAILTANIALFRLLVDLGLQPEMVAGHSLGEYAALVASGVLSFKDALMAVAIRGKAMSEVDAKDKGTMASVSGTLKEVESVLAEVDGYVLAANKNSISQTVISGSSAGIGAAIQAFEDRGMSTVRLSVSAAFHTKIVAPAAKPLSEYLDKIKFEKPKIPVTSNVSGGFFPSDPRKIRELLKKQVNAPVEWTKQVKEMNRSGGSIFFEVGPKRALTGFVNDILGERDTLTVVCNHPKKGGVQTLNEAISAAAALGLPIKQLYSTDEHLIPDYRWPQPGYKSSMLKQDVSGKIQEGIQQRPGPLIRNQYSDSLDQTMQFPRSDASLVHKLGLNLDRIVITGVGIGLPGKHKEVFDERNFERILAGENLIDTLSNEKLDQQLSKNIRRLIKKSDGGAEFQSPRSYSEVINLAGQAGKFNLLDEFKVKQEFSETYDIATSLATAAGLQALKDAGIPLVREYRKTTTGSFLPGDWVLPEELQKSTGVIFASAFPGYDSFASEITRFNKHKYREKTRKLISELYGEISHRINSTDEKEFILKKLEDELVELDKQEEEYIFNRKILLNVLSMGHSQFAQLIKAKGPNTQTNAACASTTQALSIAQDWIRAGRCTRVIIISADNITSDSLFEWLGSGFLASGAATIKKDVTQAALPFDRRREGMIIGMGAAALIVETEEEALRRGIEPIVELLGTHIANSSFHGTRLDVNHVSSELQKFMQNIERAYNISPIDIGSSLMFMSHETYTPRRGGSASAEIKSLRDTFGSVANSIYIANTKGYTGHAMGAGIEDVVAIKSIEYGQLPPIANFEEPDPDLGDLKLSKGEKVSVKYALRLAAGFGSQIAFALYERRSTGNRMSQQYDNWLTSIGGSRTELFNEGKTLRLKDRGIPSKEDYRSKIEELTPKPIAAKQQDALGISMTKKFTKLKQAVIKSEKTKSSKLPTLKQSEVVDKITGIIAEKTGYPSELLDPELDMEADLGIDTVKQAEIFGVIREEYDIPREDGIAIADYPTINSVAKYFKTKMSDSQISVIEDKSLDKEEDSVPTRKDRSEILNNILTIVAEKTGYPSDMLDPDLDMEADLGIDTVKQAELFGIIREQYDIARREDLQISDYPTLAHVADFVINSRNGSAPDGEVIGDIKQEVITEDIAFIDRDKNQIIQNVVSSQTGYPESMLEDNISLSNDLGLDSSTKELILDEIALKLKVTITTPEKNNIDSISDIHAMISGASLGGVKEEPAISPTRTDVGDKLDKTEILDKMISIISEKTGYPRDMLDPELDMEADLGIDTVKQAELFGMAREEFGIPRIEGMMISEYNTINKITDLILDSFDKSPLADIDISDSSAEISAKAQQSTYRYVLRTNHKETKAQFDGQGFIVSRKSKAANTVADSLGLTQVPSIKDLEIQDQMTMVFINPTNYQIKSINTFFKFIKKNHQSFDRLVLAIKTPQKSNGTIHEMTPLQGAIGGMFKALAMEFPQIIAKIILFEKYEQITNEIANPGVEIIYHKDRRTEVALQEHDLEKSSWKLPDKSVLLATGGAQGITYEIIKATAQSHSTLVLLGRTEIRGDAEEIANLSASEQENRKWALMDELKETRDKVTPVTLEQEWSKVIKSANVWLSIKALEDLGCHVIYRSVDVANSRVMKKFLKEIQEQLADKKITHIIHGAGIEISRATGSKKSEEFQLVYDVKTKGFENIIQNIDTSYLQRLIAFGSVAGRFGNATQVDYSAANEYLAKRCAELSNDGVPATCIAWSVWADVGMGTRGSTMQVLELQGVSAIPVFDGIQRFIDEVAFGNEVEVVISGNLGALSARAIWVEEEPNSSIMIDQFDETTNTAYRMLSLKKDQYLNDHRIGGKAVFPGVMGLEVFAQVSKQMNNQDVTNMLEVQFISPVKLPRDNNLEIVVETAKNKGNVQLYLKSKFLGPNGKQLGALRNHFKCISFAGNRIAGYPVKTKESLNKMRIKTLMEKDEIYNLFFHGPSYQVLGKLMYLSTNSVLTEFNRPKERMFASEEKLDIDPLAIEAAFQTAGLHLLLTKKKMGLPSGVGMITWFKTRKPPIYVRATLLGLRDIYAHYNIELIDADGNCVCLLQQNELIITQEAEPPKLRISRDEKLNRAKSLTSSLNPSIIAIEVDPLKDVSIQFLNDFLTDDERKRFNKLKIKKKRNEWLAGRIAAKLALSKTTQIPIESIEILKDKNRSPYAIIDDRKVDVSISHSNGLAVATSGEMGIDLDTIQDREPSFISEVFSKKEIKEHNLKNATPSLITQLWTVKEAHLKRMRIGLKTDLHKTEITKTAENSYTVTSSHGSSLCETVSDKDWVVTIATKNE